MINAGLFLLVLLGGVLFCAHPATNYPVFLLIIVLSFVLGVLAVILIGGADMPVVIALLNSYSGLAAAAAGFIIQNTVLIVAGCLVGASGVILTEIMCKAMNRSITNVLFAGFGASTTTGGIAVAGEAKAITPESAYLFWKPPHRSCLCPDTAWRWRRPSTFCESWLLCSKPTAPRSVTRFIPSPVECRVT